MLPIVVLGGGGHARVVIDTLLELNRHVLGYTVTDPTVDNRPVFGVPCLGNDGHVHKSHPSQLEVVNGVGSIALTKPRSELYLRFHHLGYHFATIVHPSAIVSKGAVMNEGVQVLAGAVIQTGCKIGTNTIVNTRASIDHDCVIGGHVHIAPGATLSGCVHVGDGTHIGTGATIIQGIVIGESCLIAAGAVVVQDVPDGALIVGVPGREKLQ